MPDQQFELVSIKKKVTAIVCFGPAGFEHDGFTPGKYYQVTIDPSKISPSGEYIRFGNNAGDEIVGWQRARAMTIVEVLHVWTEEEISSGQPILSYGDKGKVDLMAIDMPKDVLCLPEKK